MKRIIPFLILTVALAGCTLWWGGSYNRVASTPDMVQFEYELTSVNEQGMDGAAQDYCDGYQKNAVFVNRARGGYEYINTYRCVARLAPRL